MNEFDWIFLLLTISYSAFIGWCYFGWNRIPVFKPRPLSNTPFISVIIPARDEENTIAACLESLAKQDYSKDLYEVIVVDDDSSDLTSSRVRDFLSAHSDMKGSLLRTGQNGQAPFKKQAITLAVVHAKGELILSSDADCLISPSWISSMVAECEKERAVLISGPVLLTEEKTLLDKMQSLEFLGLIGIGAASIGNQRPIMCNGASIAYARQSFYKVGGYANDATSSGDDTQLLKKIQFQYPGRIKFLKSAESAVLTQCKKTLPELIQQRIRWSSKIPTRMSALTVFVAVIAFLLHAVIFLSLIFRLCQPSILVICWITKALFEFFFLWSLSSFFGKKKLLYVFLPAQIIYPVYIVWTGLLALRGTYVWKGRKQVAGI
jgi:cellulose synthase/poly-beta-1,6-N-acetylglucosamine synthase-like glycosyltransferase